MTATALKQRILQAPISRIVVGILLCFVAFILAQQLSTQVLNLLDLDKNYRNLIKGLVSISAVIATYTALYKRYERREIKEFSARTMGKNVAGGLLLGTLLQGLTMLVVIVFGEFKVLAVNPVASIIIPFTVAFSVAVFEEVLMRGIVLRITEEKLGTVVALLISASIFALLHLANPGSGLLSGLCVFAAGLVFGLAYVSTRSLWPPIAMHFAWNFTQSGIFGAVTSGNEKTSSLLTSKILGSQLITGGSFGPEASIQAVLFLLITAGVLLLKSKPNLVKPTWRNKSVPATELQLA